ncbi:MAG: hypothetical protein ACOC9A_01160 [Candidatus Bipolaricaulota bacterium]
MPELKTIKELEVDYSKSQIYWRLEKLVESGVIDSPKRGERNQYLFGPREVKALKRLAELEESQDTVKEAVAALKDEGLEEETEREVEGQDERVEELKDRIKELEEKVITLEEKLAIQDDRIQKFRNRWSDQLKGGMEKLKDLFG